MFEFLSHLPFWQMLMIVAIPCITICIVALKGINFSFGKFRMMNNSQQRKTDDSIATAKAEKTSDLLDGHVKTMMLIDAKISETTTAICKIQFKEILREQMAFAESKYVQIWGTLSRIFVSLLSDRIKLDECKDLNLPDNEDYKRYSDCFEHMIPKQIFDYIRSSFKDNHYADLDEEEFSKYADEKSDIILQIITDALNFSYHGQFITRADIYKANKAKDAQIKDMFYDVFLRARKISQDKYKEIEKLQRDKNEFIHEVIGVKL